MSRNDQPKYQAQDGQHSNWQFTFIGGSAEQLKDHDQGLGQPFQAIENETQSGFSLDRAQPGDRIMIAGFKTHTILQRFQKLGLTVGDQLQVISRTASGSTIVNYQGDRIGLGANMARQILVSQLSSLEEKLTTVNTSLSTHLWEMPIGTKCRVVGYDKTFSGYQGKLLSMGLSPGTELTVVNHSQSCEQIDIAINGCHLSLGQPEANALCVESI